MVFLCFFFACSVFCLLQENNLCSLFMCFWSELLSSTESVFFLIEFSLVSLIFPFVSVSFPSPSKQFSNYEKSENANDRAVSHIIHFRNYKAPGYFYNAKALKNYYYYVPQLSNGQHFIGALQQEGTSSNHPPKRPPKNQIQNRLTFQNKHQRST